MSYCLSCSCSCFNSFSYFISYSCFINTSIHIAFPIFFLSHACCIWHFIYLYSMTPMYSHLILVFLFLYEYTLLRNWNHSNLIIQTQVMTFSCQISQFKILIFRGLNSIYNTGSLYSFEAKVLRVLLQLESPKSEHRNSSYVLNNPDYSMIKTEA